MKKRFLSVFLALVMILSLAVPAFASTVPSVAGGKLSGIELRVYQEMKEVVQKVAAGKQTSTETTLSLERGKWNGLCRSWAFPA